MGRRKFIQELIVGTLKYQLPDGRTVALNIEKPEGEGNASITVGAGGAVISSQVVAWNDVQNKPQSFTPAAHEHDLKAHSHTFSEVSGKPELYPPEVHAHPAPSWSEISAKPDTYPPSDHSHPHTHSFAEVTDKPATYPPETHIHDYSPANHNHDLAYSAIGHTHPGATSPTSTCKQSAQVTNNSNSNLADVPGMSFNLVAGHRYYFRFMGTFQSVATTTGVGFAFSGPAVTSAHWWLQAQQAAAGTDQMYQNTATALATVLVSTGVVAANTDYLWQVEGFVTPSADGVLQLRCRSEVNASQIMIKNVGIGILEDAGIV